MNTRTLKNTDDNHASEVSFDFLALLRASFAERCRKNPNYSLRAYARALGIQASPLSAILRGKRPISETVKKQLGLALGLSATELGRYTTPKERATGPASNTARINGGALGDVSTSTYRIDEDTFAIMADWHYFALLELFELKQFKNDPRWMARVLGLKLTEVHFALERLVNCGFLKKQNGHNSENKKEKYALTDRKFTSHLTPQKTSLAKINYQRQLLELSKVALTECPIELRDHTSMVCAVNKKDLNAAREVLARARRELMALFNKTEMKDDVYQLQMALFPLTNEFKNN